MKVSKRTREQSSVDDADEAAGRPMSKKTNVAGAPGVLGASLGAPSQTSPPLPNVRKQRFTRVPAHSTTPAQLDSSENLVEKIHDLLDGMKK